MKEYISWSMTALCLRTWANIDCIGLRTFSLMFLSHPSTDVFGFLFHWCYLLTSYNFESKRNDYCLPKVSSKRTCCKRSVLRWFRSTKLSFNWNERSQFKDQRDQKINNKDQERSKDQRSSPFTDQRIKVHQRSKINKIKDHEDQLEIK